MTEQSLENVFEQLDEIVEKLVADKIDVDIAYTGLTEADVVMLHKKKLKVNCWTVNDPEIAKELIGWGVDYITTNILE